MSSRISSTGAFNCQNPLPTSPSLHFVGAFALHICCHAPRAAVSTGTTRRKGTNCCAFLRGRSNITAAEAVDREFGYIETKGEDLRHRHHHRHHHQHHPSVPKVSTEPPRVSFNWVGLIILTKPFKGVFLRLQLVRPNHSDRTIQRIPKS